jgi:hypothetical protein
MDNKIPNACVPPNLDTTKTPNPKNNTVAINIMLTPVSRILSETICRDTFAGVAQLVTVTGDESKWFDRTGNTHRYAKDQDMVDGFKRDAEKAHDAGCNNQRHQVGQ